MSANRAITLAAHPVGFPKDSDFKQVDLPKPTPGAGQFVIHTKFLTVDPYMRGRMTGVRSYVDPFQIGQPIPGGAVGEVVDSNNPSFPKGQAVLGAQLDVRVVQLGGMGAARAGWAGGWPACMRALNHSHPRTRAPLEQHWSAAVPAAQHPPSIHSQPASPAAQTACPPRPPWPRSAPGSPPPSAGGPRPG